MLFVVEINKSELLAVMLQAEEKMTVLVTDAAASRPQQSIYMT